VPLLKGLLLPAYEATVPFLVPKRHIGRANGLRMFMNGINAVLGPFAAVLLVQSIGWPGVATLVVVLLVVGILTLLAVRIPRAARDVAVRTRVPVLWADFRESWRYLRTRPGLPALLVFFGVMSFGLGITEVLLPLMVFAFASDGPLILVFSVGVVGMAAAGIAMTIWGGPRPRVRGLLRYTLLFAAAMVIGSLRPNVALVAVAAFVFLGTTSIIVGTVQTILNIKVEPVMQGRVMAVKNVFYAATLMIGDIMAGLSGGIMVPLIGDHEVRSGAVAAVVGGGPGRGFAVLLLGIGLVVALFVWLGYRHASLRELEERLPDVTPEDLALQTAPAQH
jgi:MFS transporter, DHA3 family, macrolide efflux protein